MEPEHCQHLADDIPIWKPAKRQWLTVGCAKNHKHALLISIAAYSCTERPASCWLDVTIGGENNNDDAP